MNAFAKFCRDHHAVPVAYGRGVERIAYETATDDALVGHAEGRCAAWDADLPAHVRLDVQTELAAIRAEFARRMGAGDDARLLRLLPAQLKVLSRIGAKKS